MGKFVRATRFLGWHEGSGSLDTWKLIAKFCFDNLGSSFVFLA